MKNMNFGTLVDQYMKEKIESTLNGRKDIPDIEYIETDNLGEIIEKLCILHIRTWMLEDDIQFAENNDRIAEIKKKLDICFKVKRPKLVQAINRLVDVAIEQNRSLVEDSVKAYKGIEG